jgi:hypothetical protein
VGVSRRDLGTYVLPALICLGLVALFVCSGCGPPSILGSWTEPTSFSVNTIVFESDGTFSENYDGLDGVQLDPDHVYGTYTLSGNKLHMVVYNPFSDRQREVDYQCRITAKKLTLFSPGESREYRRK